MRQAACQSAGQPRFCFHAKQKPDLPSRRAKLGLRVVERHSQLGGIFSIINLGFGRAVAARQIRRIRDPPLFQEVNGPKWAQVDTERAAEGRLQHTGKSAHLAAFRGTAKTQ